MVQLDAFKMDSKVLVPKLSKMGLKQQALIKHEYDVTYMFRNYGVNKRSFLEWMLNKMQPTGNEAVLDYSYIKHLIPYPEQAYFNSFEKVYVLANANQPFRAKLKLFDCFLEIIIRLNYNIKIDVPSNSVDYIYANYRFSPMDEAEEEVTLLEFLRILKSTGTLYLTALSSEYYSAIHKLFEEYDVKEVNLSFQNIDQVTNRLKGFFEDVRVDTYKTDLWITNADDLISYILLDPELKHFNSVISSQGISKLRHSLAQKIQKDGGILIPYHVNVIESRQGVQLKLV